MLSVNNYTQPYVDECRANVDAQIACYAALIKTAREQATAGTAPLDSAIDSFESHFFNHMILVLDAYFMHRSRTLEGKDGNPLNEVRVLSESIRGNSAKMGVDKTIKFKPGATVLNYSAGDEIKLSEADFVKLSRAFFEEIERKFA